MHNDLTIQRPEHPSRLVLLFHGVGSSAQDLLPVGQVLAGQLPEALVASVRAPDAAGPGWQWFSVQGVTESNRSARVAEAMPGFAQAVQRWQQESHLDPAATTLIGFSQGAIMALESLQLPQPLAGCVVAMAGRFAQPPRAVSRHTRVHLLHGDADAVMPVRLAADAQARLQALGTPATLDRFPGLGHGIDGRMLGRLVQLLQ